MSEENKKYKLIERRTYLKGKFYGKFIGFLDPQKSDFLHENYYDLEVLEGNIYANKNDLKHYEKGSFKDFQPEDKFITKLPELINLEVSNDDGTKKYFKISLHEPRLKNYQLSNQVYDDNILLGDIEGEISGYIRHHDKEEISETDDTTIEYSDTLKPTGEHVIKGDYSATVYEGIEGEKTLKKWDYKGSGSFLSAIGYLISIIYLGFMLLFLLSMIVYAWKFFLPLAIIIGFIYLISGNSSIVSRIWFMFLRLLSIAFVLLFLYSLFNFIKEKPIPKDWPKYVEQDDESLQESIEIPNDSLIRHKRIWSDYENVSYETEIKIKVNDYFASNSFRNDLPSPIQSLNHYNTIVESISDFDKNKLQYLYNSFDSIRDNNSLNKMKFAEVITSCIQDIPYSLILDNSCRPELYNDAFIQNYLKNGGKCKGFVKFGLLSPVEFMSTLDGDCDTRTLLLFTILNHYGFDVALLSSEIYRHSILGINLPYKGANKIINGKRYVLWETTSESIPPGEISKEISNMRYWTVSLISKI
jgi:hypothetical protein